MVGRVVIYDDDHFYMGSVIAEALVARGCVVEFVTPAVKVAEWCDNTLEQGTIMRRLMGLGVNIHLSMAPAAIGPDGVTLECVWTGRQSDLPCHAVLMVTSRTPDDTLYQSVIARRADWQAAGIRAVKLIGDASAPGPIAWATYAGRRFAEELDMADAGDALTFRREIAGLITVPSLLP